MNGGYLGEARAGVQHARCELVRVAGVVGGWRGVEVVLTSTVHVKPRLRSGDVDHIAVQRNHLQEARTKT